MEDTETVKAPAPGTTQLLDRVRGAWAEVLGLTDAEEVPLDTNFLEAGGNSMLLIMLWEELHGLSDGVLRVSDLFQHSTVSAQVALIAGDTGQGEETTQLGARDRGRLLGRARNDQPAAE